MISAAMKFKLLTLATKYGVEVEHFIPGNVVVRINSNQQNERKFISLFEDLKKDPQIRDIIWEHGVVAIQYDADAVNNQFVIDRWLQLVEKYSF